GPSNESRDRHHHHAGWLPGRFCHRRLPVEALQEALTMPGLWRARLEVKAARALARNLLRTDKEPATVLSDCDRWFASGLREYAPGTHTECTAKFPRETRGSVCRSSTAGGRKVSRQTNKEIGTCRIGCVSGPGRWTPVEGSSLQSASALGGRGRHDRSPPKPPRAAMQDLKHLIRTIPDYPKKGILFRDVTTLFGNAAGFKAAVAQMAAPYADAAVEAVAGIEARGFILGGAIADRLGCGVVPLRKEGKLPWKTIGQEYTLEYGVDIIEMHEDAVRTGERVLIVDDLIATGGSAEAAVKLVRRSGGEVVGATFIIDLPDLGGRKRLGGLGVVSQVLLALSGHLRSWRLTGTDLAK